MLIPKNKKNESNIENTKLLPEDDSKNSKINEPDKIIKRLNNIIIFGGREYYAIDDIQGTIKQKYIKILIYMLIYGLILLF